MARLTTGVGLWVAVCLLSLAVLPAPARAGYFVGRYQNVFESYRALRPDKTTYEFLPVSNLFQVEVSGLGERQNISLVTYFRDTRQAAEGGGAFDLLYGYGRIEDLFHWVDLQLGRQFQTENFGWRFFDGLTATLKPLSWANATLYGGVPAIAIEGDSEYEWDEVALLGGRVGLSPPIADDWPIQLSLGYEEKRETEGYLRQRGGADLMLGMPIPVSVYANIDYEILTEEASNAQVGIDARWPSGAMIDAQWRRIVPQFDLDSIFVVFNREAYQESRISFSKSYKSGLHTSLFYSVLLFDSSPGISNVNHLGGGSVSYRWDERNTASFSAQLSNGWGGPWHLFNLEADHWLVQDQFQLAGGLNMAIARKSSNLESESEPFWDVYASARRIFGSWGEFSVRANYYSNDRYESDWRIGSHLILFFSSVF